MICSIEGCENKVLALGWCNKHYLRNKRHGNPLKGNTFYGAPLAYLKAHMYDGCSTEWSFAKAPNGYGKYGQIMFQGKLQGVHQVSFLIGNNLTELPKGMVVRHLCNCGHLGCFNFECLALGTKRDDVQDQIKAGTWQHGETHAQAKLSSEQIDEIRRLGELGNIHQQIADMFNCSRRNISKIIRFESRKNG
jgi:hypothetical protein